VEHYGKLVPGVTGNWAPLIDVDTHTAVEVKLSDPTRRLSTGSGTKWLSAGLIYCGVCGSILRSASASKNQVATPIYRCAKKVDHAPSDGLRHTTARRDDIDPIVREEIVKAFLFGPEYLVPEGDRLARRVQEIETALVAIKRKRSDLKEMVKEYGLGHTDVRADLLQLKREEDQLLVERADIAERSAHAAMMVDSRAGLFTRGKASFEQAATAKQDLYRRFDRLSLAHQRALLKSLLRVTIHHGKGTHRFEVEHLVVRHLNEPGAYPRFPVNPDRE
jgi:hypothetical protein